MTSRTLGLIFFPVIFTLLNPVKSAADTLICWDGKYVLDFKMCDEKPQAQTFSMFGGSTEGAEVSTFTLDDKVRLIEITEFGEMGKADYYITNLRLEIRSTRYNQPFYMDGFDPKKSTKDWESYRIERTDNGNVLAPGDEDKDQLSDKRADSLACMIQAINQHVTQSNDILMNLHIDCD